MLTRRKFMEVAAGLIGGAGLSTSLFKSIARAAAIEPDAGTSFRDAQHIVILMQENRSFDHAFGSLRGVRGFNDPRAIRLAGGEPVWVQANKAGEHYVPFRLDLKGSKATWMGCLPHSWADQVDARNGGLHDGWLPAKRLSDRAYAKIPFTMGYYTRDDIPFYYALADAFTICDQYFCSTLTGTTPNRLHLWTGTIRERQSSEAFAHVYNDEADLEHRVRWPTFPERLEDLGVSWKVYQNELSVPTGLSKEELNWLGNFDDNPLEFFEQYHVFLAPQRRKYVQERLRAIPGQLGQLEQKLASGGLSEREEATVRRHVRELKAVLARFQTENAVASNRTLEQLSEREKQLHRRAFAVNDGDPSYRHLAGITYSDGDMQRQMRVPKGDVLHQFRADVQAGQLPTVSWLVSAEAFSDHPSSAWYGAWYIAEVLDILTRNPEVWKKTIFMLNYDENDGYFDHVPPFVSPRPGHPETGRVTAGIDASLEYVELEQDLKRHAPSSARGSPLGLGYRVPMVIASPWSRGGCVCSQVFDHTSVLQFLEVFLSQKLAKPVVEPNINRWRRTVCGDLTSSFQTASDLTSELTFPPRNQFLSEIHRAQFKDLPTGYRPLSAGELEQLRQKPSESPLLPRQEPGVRKSCPLPYELSVDGSLSGDRKQFQLRLAADRKLFGDRAAGAAFIVYVFRAPGQIDVRNYAIEAGQHLDDAWSIADFGDGRYLLRVYGPNGFFREFRGSGDGPNLTMECAPDRRSFGKVRVIVTVHNNDAGVREIALRHNAYGYSLGHGTVGALEKQVVAFDLQPSAGWYDFSLFCPDNPGFEMRYAGRIETGQWSTSDPAMA